MARTGFTGFGLQSAFVDFAQTSLPSGLAYETTIVRTGAASLKMTATSGVNGAGGAALSSLGSSSGWFRAYLRVTARPSATARILFGATGGFSIRLNPSGTLGYYNAAGALVGTTTTALTDTSRWYMVEFRGGGGTGATLDLMRIDGTVEVTGVLGTAVNWSGTTGPNDTVADTYTVYVADVAADGATWCGAGAVATIFPDADNSVGSGWTTSGGAATGLWDNVNNAPPIGIADTTANAGKQVRNASANTNYVARMQSYTTAGVSGTVNAVQSLVIVGAPVVTGAKTGSQQLTANPAAGAATAFAGNVATNYWAGAAAGTYPTGWKVERAPLITSPSVTLGTNPTLSLNITGGTASRIAMCCAMALIVEYTPVTGTSVTPDVGALSFTGFAPSVAVTNNQAPSPGVGALSFAGFAPTVSGVTPSPMLYYPGDSLAGATVTRASTATYFDDAGVMRTAASGVARDGHYIGGVRTLLVEPSRTQPIRNSNGVGTGGPLNGASGAIPPQWDLDSDFPAGTVSTITTDPKFIGNVVEEATNKGSTGAGAVRVHPQENNGAKAATVAGDVWTVSIWARVTAGQIGNLRLGVQYCNASDAIIGSDYAAVSPVPTTSNGWQFYQRTVTVPSLAGLSYVIPFVFSDFFTTAAHTYQVSAPQLELAAYPTSYIPTINVASVTRAADSIALPVPSGLQGFPSTLYEYYWDEATAAWVENVSAYTPGTTITLTTGRAYRALKIAGGTRNLAYMQALGEPRAAPGTGALTFAGFAPNVVVGIRALVGVAALALAGFAPTVAVSNNQTVTPGVGALALTGFSPTVAVSNNQAVLPGTGALNLAGFAPNVVIGYRALAGVGALSLTGFAPSVAVSNNQSVVPGTGALSLSGFAPNAIVDVRPAPGVGALALTGFAPNVAVSNNQSATPGVGALAFTGFSPSAIVGVRALVGVGALALTGFSPTVAVSNNQAPTPGTAALSLTGFSPSASVSNNQSVTPGTGALTFTGFAPVLATQFFPGTAALSLTGFAPTVAVSNHQTALPGTGALSLTGFAPSAVIGIRALVGTGALALAGFAPSIAISNNQSVTPGVGALSLAGLAPSVVIGYRALAGVGALTLTGFAPTVVVSNHQRPTPGTGQLALAGFAPLVTIGNAQNMQPGTGALALTGFPPTVTATAHQNVQPGAGVLSLAGLAPTVTATAHQNMQPGAGALTFTGYAPTAFGADRREMFPGTAVLALTGFAPTVFASDRQEAFPGAAALALTGFAPTVVATDHKIAAPGVGALVLDGYAPDVEATAHQNMQPGTGALVFTGYAPTAFIAGASMALDARIIVGPKIDGRIMTAPRLGARVRIGPRLTGRIIVNPD